jgi:hypothetical protein
VDFVAAPPSKKQTSTIFSQSHRKIWRSRVPDTQGHTPRATTIDNQLLLLLTASLFDRRHDMKLHTNALVPGLELQLTDAQFQGMKHSKKKNP